jgi:BNR repeat-containing family member
VVSATVGSRIRGALVALALAAAASGAAVTPGAAAPPPVTLLSDTQLDATGIYFVSFDGLVNNESFQQDGILTFAGFQYAAWYTASRSAVIARRRLPSGAWERAVLPHTLSVDDSHNVISLGVSPADGRLHVAMDTHDSPVFYLRSEAGLVTAPDAHPWSAAAFGAVQRTLGGVDLGSITYPQFILTPERTLQLSYRTGSSGNGTNELAEYDGNAWRRLGRWSASTGSWTSTNGVVSTSRNMYLHGLTYGPSGRLHAAFTWREGNSAVLCNQGGLTNHDTGYVFSDDRGRTWRNNAGQLVGATGSQLVAVNSPGLVVDPLDPNHGLINQESQALDSTGAPHVLISYVPGRFTQCVTSYAAQRRASGRTFFLSRAANGSWTKMEIPVPSGSTQRSRLVFDRADNAYVVMPFGRIVAASRASGWTDWTTVFQPSLNIFGEVDVDTSRVASAGVLSVLYQRASSGTTPSPVRVADLQLG